MGSVQEAGLGQGGRPATHSSHGVNHPGHRVDAIGHGQTDLQANRCRIAVGLYGAPGRSRDRPFVACSSAVAAGAGVVAAADLVDGVLEDLAEYGHAVAHAAGGAGQVDDQRGPGLASHAAGQSGGGNAGGDAGGHADGLGETGDLAVDEHTGSSRG